jgi:pseudaminic acid cytidylyltransferase
MTCSADSRPSVAVIPARGGSKRIPRKNIVDFHGRPLIAWAIEAVLTSGSFSHVLVSTDDDDIAAIASSEGAEVPFSRPAELSGDGVATAPVVEHALADFRERTGIRPTVIGVVYPAAVFTTGADLVRSVRLLSDLRVDMVMSAGRFSSPVQRSWRRTHGQIVERVDPSTMSTRSQDLEDRYFDAGQFYVSTPEAWSAIGSGKMVRTAIYEMEPWRVWDIDTPQDLEMARRLFSTNRAESGQA